MKGNTRVGILKNGSWDRGLDYESVYALLTRSLKRKHSYKYEVCYDSILLIQLRNGARVSEAAEAFQKFLLSRSSEVYVNVRKRKETKRLIIIPEELNGAELDVCLELVRVDTERLTDRVKQYCRRKYRFNTHSLRYAFITYLVFKKNVPPVVVAKITKHRKLDFILHYTQELIGENVLRSLDKV